MEKSWKDILKLLAIMLVIFLFFIILHSVNQVTVKMRVLEVHDSYLIVQDLYDEGSTEIYMVPFVASKNSDFENGDVVMIRYNGIINDSHPGSMEGVTKVKHVEE